MLLRRISGGIPAGSLKFSSTTWRGYCAVAAKKTLTDESDAHYMPLSLLGPPELYRSPPTTADDQDVSSGAAITATDPSTGNQDVTSGVAPTATDPSTGDPFMDSMLSSYNRFASPLMGRTENYSPTYKSSGNPCLDFFFHVVPNTPAVHVGSRLKSAWDLDPSTALKLVFNLRGLRGTGKADMEGFYASALWLQENHPKTLAGNVKSVAKFGYYKDLLEILYRLLEGLNVRKDEKARIRRAHDRRYRAFLLEKEGDKGKSHEEKRLAAAKKGIERYNNDPTYRFLHSCVSQLFAEHLQSDLEKMRSGISNDFSLAAKWCPSLYTRYDNSTLICESIARRLFPRDQYAEYDGIEEAHYAYRVRDRLRKEVLAPLRKALKLPEVYMSAREWSSVVYMRVASIAMKNYAELFQKHDGERFSKYLENVAQGKLRIAAGALLPHEVIKKVKSRNPITRIVSDLQWKRIVEDLSNIGKLNNCLAICDVSGSMYGLPLEVSVALGLLVSELSEEPWKGKLITFSMEPQLQVIRGENLRSKVDSIERMYWHLNTDFQRVFDKILDVAVEGKLTEDQMIKRLFVFSDMEFDEASANDWETDYQAIVRKFNEKGFSRVPEIVFWNLTDSNSTPVLSNQKGVALVSGFSKNLLKMFLDEGGLLDAEKTVEAEVLDSEKTTEAEVSEPVKTVEAEALDPVKTMEAAISGEEYEELVVLD